MLARHTLRTHLKAGRPPAEAIRLTREALDDDLSGELRTVTAAVYDPAGQELRQATLGESAPLFALPGAGEEPVAAVSSDGIAEGTAFLPIGARVALYTSGLEEARLEGSRLGREGVGEIFEELGGHATAETLLEKVAARSRSLPSDLAACVLEPDDDPALTSTKRVRTTARSAHAER